MHLLTDPVSKLAQTSFCAKDVWVRPGKTDYVSKMFDADSRRWVKVTWSQIYGIMQDNDADSCDWEEYGPLAAPMLAAVRAELDANPNLTALVVSKEAEVLCRSTDPYDDVTPGTHYASLDEYHIPAHIKTLARDELVEVDRIIAFVDVVIPASSPSPEPERLVFKHYQFVGDLPGAWNAINIGANLSNHPHIAPLRHVIVDETDRSRVVGYTVPFYRGGTLADIPEDSPWTFKLKWAKQLLQTIDDLHLKYGVIHCDLNPGNIFIDSDTDSLVLIDFGLARKIGTAPYSRQLQAALSPEDESIKTERFVAEDVKWGMRLVYGQVTGTNGWSVPVSNGNQDIPPSVLKKGDWVKGPNVTLDSPVEEYHKLVVDWLHKRNTGLRITHYSQASEPLDYPDYMPPPQVDIDAHIMKRARDKANEPARLAKTEETAELNRLRGSKPSPRPPPPPEPELLEDMLPPKNEMIYNRIQQDRWWEEVEMDKWATSGRHFLRLNAIEAGLPVLSWERPLTVNLDRTRRLLANGKYEDECAGADTQASQRKRKHGEEVEEAEAQEQEEQAGQKKARSDDGDDEGSSDGGGKTCGKTATDKAKTVVQATGRITRSATRKVNGTAPPPKTSGKTSGSTSRKTSRKTAVAKKARGGAGATTRATKKK